MADWTHRICVDCWVELHPGRQPSRFKADLSDVAYCCFCHSIVDPAVEGGAIFVREDPKRLACEQLHAASRLASGGPC